ncbi:hydrogenase maturation protease [Streptomyces sanyensis]|uniref:Hydrogenase maturation protease n=1 Tax=Streptomyces sanyensis TaxID=568869 RepID=A0ABP9BAT9_9ACTN
MNGDRYQDERTPRPAPTAVVIGVGNEFRRDDGVGWAVLRRMEERATRRPLPPGTLLALSDGEPSGLIGHWEGTGLTVVVDAVHTDPAVPGRVHRLDAAEVELCGPGPVTSHGLGFGQAAELAAVLGRLPSRLRVYAVETADTSLGPGLTAAVEAAVAPLAERIEEEIRRFHHEAPGGPVPHPT